MIKRIVRAAVGVVFFFVFFIFLLLGAVRFRLLDADFWKAALVKGRVYEQLRNQTTKMAAGFGEQVRREAGGTALPKEVADLLAVGETLTAERYRELVETNLDRILGYLNGQRQDLTLFLPVKEWDLPVAMFGPKLKELTAETTLAQALTTFGQKEEQLKQFNEGVAQIKAVAGGLTPAFMVFFILALGLLAGHFFLGVGLPDRIAGTAWLLAISGLVAKLVGIGAGSFFELIAANSKPPMESWVKELGRSLVGQFFDLGATIGLVVGIIGLAGIAVTLVLVKQGKLKTEKEGPGLLKRLLAFVLGVILGLTVIFGLAAAAAAGLGGGVKFSAGEGGLSFQAGSRETAKTTGEESLSGKTFESKAGWMMKQPSGWEYISDEASDGFLKRPVKSTTDWAAMEVKKTPRQKEVDQGTWLATFKKAFAAGSLGFEGGVLAEEPKESSDKGRKRFDFVIDYDAVISETPMRLRFWRVEFYPEDGGDGFAVNSRVPVDWWETYSPIIQTALGTFEFAK